MKIDEVPQDNGMIADHGHEICYAVDENGRYRLVPSLGWEAKNIVNDQAWEVISSEAEKMYNLARTGAVSPLAYYQVKHQMDLGLLAKYASLPKWRVRRHLKPSIFNKLPDRILKKYSSVFGISIEELRSLPESFSGQQVKTR